MCLFEPTPIEIKINNKPLDLWVQDSFYNFDTHKWCIDSSNRFVKFLGYHGPKALIIILGAVIITLLFFPKKFWQKRNLQARWFAQKRRLLLLVLALAITPLVCGNAKNYTNTYCPWDVTRYGGHAPYVRLFEKYPPEFAAWQKAASDKAHGFPAGHASGGFALMALAFLATKRRTQAALILFASALGWWMGLYQMLRGAHYLSHTLATWIIAALIITLLAKFLPKPPPQTPSPLQPDTTNSP